MVLEDNTNCAAPPRVQCCARRRIFTAAPDRRAWQSCTPARFRRGRKSRLESRLGLPGYDVPFARFTPANGVLADSVFQLAIRNVRFRENCRICRVDKPVAPNRDRLRTCGRQRLAQPGGAATLPPAASCWKGTSDLRVTRCAFRNIRGNGIWTPRSIRHRAMPGVFAPENPS